MHFKSTGTAKVHSVRCCVLFDRESGAILHVHRVVTMKGAAEKSEAEIELRVLRLARENGIAMHNAEVTHVDAEAFTAHALYEVDTRTKTLRRMDTSTRPVHR